MLANCEKIPWMLLLAPAIAPASNVSVPIEMAPEAAW